ncbi:hypothetical protein [Streptomyces sp. Amel2xC10]|uniref:hypothetical protein n=1 Tax=Streptomyces sp. Amel2xC10 TaxID=1305826 RepID=UPI000A0902C6|nr:hypothetical protein [Streptomyces sp. Amel2xC10]SMF86016.1 hypothetical protein SAMN02745830_07107 [Streptomyces sp. Amel2xC10]
MSEHEAGPVKRRGGSARKPIAHGTYRGARQHRYRKEPLCRPCRDAENAYQREQYARNPRKRAARKQTQYLTEEEWQARVAARREAGAS